MIARLLAPVALALTSAASAQVCEVPVFTELQPRSAAAGVVPLRVTNLMRIGLGGSITQMGFDTQGLALAFSGERKLLIRFDDASLAHRHNGVAGSAGPLMMSMFTGSTPDGCTLLQTTRLASMDYRVRLQIGTVTVFGYGVDGRFEFTAIHSLKPDVVVQGLAKGYDRDSFMDLIARIQPPEQE